MRLEKMASFLKVTSWVQVFRQEPTGNILHSNHNRMHVFTIFIRCVCAQHVSEGQETFVELTFSLSTTCLPESNLGHLSGLVTSIFTCAISPVQPLFCLKNGLLQVQ